MKIHLLLACSLFLGLCAVYPSAGQIPRILSYQAVLSDSAGAPKPDGTYQMTFRMYFDSASALPAWIEVQSLQVNHGLFSAVLGSVTPFPDSLSFDSQYWLGIQVESEAELPQRISLTPVGMSIRAIWADTAKSLPDNSLTSEKIAGGQVVKSINNLFDNITLQGANGASVTTNGDTITITASGGSGGGISTIQNTDNTLAITNPAGPTATVNLKSPLVIPGNIGIGGTPLWPLHVRKSEPGGSGLQARVSNTSTSSNSFATFSLEANNGVVASQMVADGLGTGPLATPSTYIGTYTSHPLGFVTNNVERMRISAAGFVGIGTTSPSYNLDVNGFMRALSTAGGNIVSETDGGTNAWAKFWVRTPVQSWSIGTSNNFNGNQLYFSNESAGLIRMAIMPDGNVGINHTNPQARLHVVNTTGVGVRGESSSGTGVYAVSASGPAVFAEGNASQSRDKGGFVKAMAYVNGDGALLRSYNGVNSGAITSAREAGFSSGVYLINFPFQVNDRFVSLALSSHGSAYASYQFNGASSIEVIVQDASGTSFTDRPVMVIVY
jgi:hypothetical protein